MTKLTTERLDEIANIKITEFSDGTDTANGAYQSVGSSEIVLMARQLLAYEQAGKNEVALPEALKYAEIYGRAFICVDRSGSVHAVNPSQITLTILNETAPAQPVIPEGLLQAINRLLDNDGSRGRFSAMESYDARKDLELLLASAAQQNEPQNIPENILAQPVSEPYKLNSWISVADRLPSEFGRYLCYVEEQNDLGKSHYQWNCSWNGDVFSDSALTGRVTHWMPLPAAPAQESE